MKRSKQMLAALAAAALLAVAALPAAAAGENAQFAAVPQQSEIATGDSVTLSIQCTAADADPAAAAFTFDIGEGYVFTEARAGEGISIGELSYSYQDGQLVLLYLDGAGGGSPLAVGGEMATVTLQASAAAEGAPMTCTETDVSAIDAAGSVVALDSSFDVDSVTVTGETVPVETPAPVLVEEGEESDFEAAAATPAPARGDASAATGAGNEAAGEPQQADEGGESEAPAPTPYFTTTPDGERIQVVPGGETETVDRTQEVLGGQPATTPVPSKGGAPAAGDGAAETAGLPVALVVLAVVAVVAVAALVIGMAVKPKRRRRR